MLEERSKKESKRKRLLEEARREEASKRKKKCRGALSRDRTGKRCACMHAFITRSFPASRIVHSAFCILRVRTISDALAINDDDRFLPPNMLFNLF